jgi:hypothetical protein
MRARQAGTGSEFRLFQDERGNGWMDVTAVSFRGFETPDDAILAATVAHRALVRRREQQPHTADAPTLLPPTPEMSGIGGVARRMRQFANGLASV